MVLLEGEISIVRHKRVIAKIVPIKNTDHIIDEQKHINEDSK